MSFTFMIQYLLFSFSAFGGVLSMACTLFGVMILVFVFAEWTISLGRMSRMSIVLVMAPILELSMASIGERGYFFLFYVRIGNNF